MNREIPIYTLEGVPDADVSTHYVTTGDKLGLSLLRFWRADCDDVVMVIHGLTTSSDMFIMPEHMNLVRYLLDHGFSDVWCFDFRMSNRHPYNLFPHRYTMDHCAAYDHPAALAKIREVAGNRRIHVIAHCLGSNTFMMSLAANKVEVASVIANSVALTPRVPTWSKIKGAVFPFMVERVFSMSYVNPGWAHDPHLSLGKVFSKIVSAFHRECDVPACHMLSLMWGTGWPALYDHKNLHEITHKRGADLYGATSVNYHRHAVRMARRERAVKMNPGDAQFADMPDDYAEAGKRIETPVLFMTGRENRVFTDSNIVNYEMLNAARPGLHELAIFDGYGHQDPFMGKNNHVDIFPRLVSWLEQHSGERAQPEPRAAAVGD